jgi:hypothetical protein
VVRAPFADYRHVTVTRYTVTPARLGVHHIAGIAGIDDGIRLLTIVSRRSRRLVIGLPGSDDRQAAPAITRGAAARSTRRRRCSATTRA